MTHQIPGEPYTRISAEEAYEKTRTGGVTVIDVRNSEEWTDGHVEGAKWLPVDEVITRFDEFPKDGDLLFICEIGQRSGLACEYAAAMGVDSTRLYNIEDGTPAWIGAGYPHVLGDYP